ncbi:MAG: hypothetical protein IT374_21005 [Polyangiaceae bacterium]|nr:hypothetical protein [Polyangiaceae bacterium]
MRADAWLVAAVASAHLACRRADPAPPPPPAASIASAQLNLPAPDGAPPPSPRRFDARSPEDSELLRAHAESLRAHFGATTGPLEVMAAPGAEGRVILLVQAKGAKHAPLVLVSDARRALLWTKARPLAGTARGGRLVSIAGGPDGDVLIAWCDDGSGALAARRWDAEGGLLADYQLLPSATCDSLTSLYWPGEGWVVVASLLGAGRAQLLGERGALRWGHEGLSLGRGFRAPTPHTIVQDTDRSVIVLGYGYAELGRGDRAVAWRVSREGRVSFRVELGDAPRGALLPALDAERLEAGLVRVSLSDQRVEITSEGQVRLPR